jgi:hypothetical protein
MFRINLVPPSSGNMQYHLQCLDNYRGHNVPPLMSPFSARRRPTAISAEAVRLTDTQQEAILLVSTTVQCETHFEWLLKIDED